jgi:Ser/Thr protein kinase RdoA (MazF antagonist)
MTRQLYVKRYTDPARCATALANYRWLASLDSGIRMPALRDAGSTHLAFEHLGDRQPGPGQLPVVAEALGTLHATAHTRQLRAAGLDQPFTTANGLRIDDFVTERRHALRQVPLELDGLPATVYKDSNVRNFLLTDDGVAVIDFDDLTLAPFGYDLAKLIVAAAMTHGPLSRAAITAALDTYNTCVVEAVGQAAACPLRRLRAFADMHHVMTAGYLHRNGYRHAWPDVTPLH